MRNDNNLDNSREPVQYIGNAQVVHERYDGGLRPAVGVQCYQAFRANRERPEWSEGYGWTYNHQPYLAYWNEQFYLEYLSCPVGENQDMGQTLLMKSRDGIHWSKPEVVFPPYEISDGLFSIMHQRMGFYVSKSGRLLALAFYGPACPFPWPDTWNMPNDGMGIGRVVREIYRDGSFGPICFIRYNTHAGWSEENTRYPFFQSSPDRGFVQACEELLADRLMTLQWWEEDRSKDGFYAIEDGKGFSWYHREDGKVVGLWKWSKAALSSDEGKSWTPMTDVRSLVMAGAKVWGQKTADGKYALVYNPTRDNGNRWPLAAVTGEEGAAFDHMLFIHGEVSPRKYSGFCKDFGPQYVRGIEEGNGNPPGQDFWLTYSMNKEDLWVSRVPLPIRGTVTGEVKDTFEDMVPGGVVRDWNIYSGQWATVQVVELPHESNRCLEFRDRDPYEYAKAFRVFEECSKAVIRFKVRAEMCTGGVFEVEVLDKAGNAAILICLGLHGKLGANKGRDLRVVGNYPVDRWMDVELRLDMEKGVYHLLLDGLQVFEKAEVAERVASVERLSFRTGNHRTEPELPTSSSMFLQDLPHAGIPVPEAVYRIDDVEILPHQ